MKKKRARSANRRADVTQPQEHGNIPALFAPRQAAPPSSQWTALLQQACQARQAEDWDQVEQLLYKLRHAKDAPPRDQPTQEVLVWYKLKAEWAEHTAAYWQDRAFIAEGTHLSVAQVERITREVLRTLVRRAQESLDAAGAPNPSVHDLCRTLLAEVDGVQVATFLEEDL